MGKFRKDGGTVSGKGLGRETSIRAVRRHELESNARRDKCQGLCAREHKPLCKRAQTSPMRGCPCVHFPLAPPAAPTLQALARTDTTQQTHLLQDEDMTDPDNEFVASFPFCDVIDFFSFFCSARTSRTRMTSSGGWRRRAFPRAATRTAPVWSLRTCGRTCRTWRSPPTQTLMPSTHTLPKLN
jgi:hypothetical protein